MQYAAKSKGEVQICDQEMPGSKLRTILHNIIYSHWRLQEFDKKLHRWNQRMERQTLHNAEK